MAGHELDNKAENMESHQTSNLSSLSPELFQSGSIHQLNKLERSATITNNGFPQFELVKGNTIKIVTSNEHARGSITALVEFLSEPVLLF